MVVMRRFQDRRAPRVTVRPRGFSLVEVMLVLVIISTMAAIAVPRFATAQAQYRVEIAAERLASDLEYASVLARTRGGEIKIKFIKGDESDESYYWFETVADPDRPGSLYTVVLRNDPYRVVLLSAPPDISFEPDGLPSQDREFIVSAGVELERTVTVVSDTGEVSIR